MSDAKDREMMAELADALQGDSFFHIVIDEIEKRKGRPLTEIERRQYLSDLRNKTSVRVSSEEADAQTGKGER